MTETTTHPAAVRRARREQLRARNQDLRSQVESTMADLDRRVAHLKTAQDDAAAVTGTATSADGLVRVLVNAAGVVVNTEVHPDAFTRSTPQALGRSMVQATQAAARDARMQVDAVMAPLTEGASDLADLVPGAASLRDLLPQVPEPPLVPPTRVGGPPELVVSADMPAPAPSRPVRRPVVTDYDDTPSSFLRRAGA